MKRLYFIRHGLSANNKAGLWSGQLDVKLLPEGRHQAEQAAAKAKQQDLRFDLIVSSALQRAYDTAYCIAEAFSYPTDKIIANELFNERCYGELQGTKYSDIMDKYVLDETIVDSYPGAETTAQLQVRAEAAWVYLQSLAGDSILLASHGAFGRALRRAILHEPINVIGRQYNNAEIERIF